MEPYLLSLFTFFAGLLLGNRLAIGRDKRKEFNNVAQPIRAWLLDEIENPSPYNKRLTPIEIDPFVNCLPVWKRSTVRAAYECQDRARNDAEIRSATGEVSYGDDVVIKMSLQSCLRYTRRR